MSDLIIRPEEIEELAKKFHSLPAETRLTIVSEALRTAVVKAEANQEKAATLDRLTSVEKWWSMQQAAAMIAYHEIGQNNLFGFLRSQGVLMNTPARWNLPYREYIERGYFKIIEYEVDLPDGRTVVKQKTVVSQKGLDFIRRKLSESNNDQPVEE